MNNQHTDEPKKNEKKQTDKQNASENLWEKVIVISFPLKIQYVVYLGRMLFIVFQSK